VEGVDAILVDAILLSLLAQLSKCQRAKKGEIYKSANNNQQCSRLLTLLVEGGSQLNLPSSGFSELLNKKLSNIGKWVLKLGLATKSKCKVLSVELGTSLTWISPRDTSKAIQSSIDLHSKLIPCFYLWCDISYSFFIHGALCYFPMIFVAHKTSVVLCRVQAG
jgi:hypothetical protein